MAKKKRKFPYFPESCNDTYGVLITLVTILVYEIILLYCNNGNILYRNSVDLLLRTLVKSAGIAADIGSLGFVVLIGAAIWLHKRPPLSIKIQYLPMMILESSVYAFIVGLLVSNLSKFIILAANNSGQSLVLQIGLSLGAGGYEELIFRALLFYYSAFMLIEGAHLRPELGYYIAALLSSVAFVWIHYWNMPFDLYSALFRFLAGLFFCVLYYWRGLGIATLTHVFYDFFVIYTNNF